ncbi:uncharacterized protein [Phyllobates terribilis]|uniref:uncharacterized protein isoform X3 n=1 Tax=Phyllobates terribilis TaxID=111132 RepID=UPI003CCAE20B
MALKDIKNEPSVTSGLKRPLNWLKRRLSESGCPSSLHCGSKFGKGDVEQDLDCSSAALRTEQNLNFRTNAPLALQDKEGNASVLRKMEISRLSGLKHNDGVVSPVLSKEILPHDDLFSSPDSYSASTVSGVSNMSLSYFTDRTTSNESEEQDPTEISINGDKYFSTPMPSKERVKKRLTPVMEVDIESNMSDELQPQDILSRIDLLHKKSYPTDVLSHESPTKTPLYRSFFAAECQEIVNQIVNIETDVRTKGKCKVEELDASTIDAEPPPFDCTPMKSMLACEVPKVISSLESSPVNKELSLFGVSLLDLEKTDLQLDDWNQSECHMKNNTGCSASDAEGLSLLTDGLNGVCAKRQKTDPLDKKDCKVIEKKTLSPLAAASGEKRNQVLSNILHTEQELSDNVMTMGMSSAQVVNQVMKASPQTLVLTMNNPGPSTTCTKQMGNSDEHNLCPSTAQDIDVTYDALTPTDATHLLEKSKALTDPRLSITSIHEMTIENATHVIEILPPTSNTTHDIPFIQEEMNLANTTQVNEMVCPPPANTTLDIASVHDDAISGNTTQVMDAVPLSTNTTQDLTPVHEGVTAAITTQVIEVVPQILANTTQDLPFTNESKAANTTHEIEVVPQLCVNAQDIAPVYMAATPTNIIQAIEIPKASANRVPGTTASCGDSIPTCCTQDAGGMQKSFVLVPGAGEATATLCADTNPKALCNAKESCEQTDNHSDLFKEEIQPSLNMTLDAPARHSDVIGDLSLHGATGTKAEMSISNSDYSLNAENRVKFGNLYHQALKQEALVGNDGNDLLSVAPNAQTSVVVTCVATGPSILVSPPVQANPIVTEGQKLEGSAKSGSNYGPGMMASQTGVDICKESGNQPLLSESCSMIQEEENAHDISVFSVGSLSFVTSTPVPGLNDFQYQKTVVDSVQQNPSLSLCSVLDESANKVSRGQQMNTPHNAQGLNCKDQLEMSHGSSIPLRLQRGLFPPSEAMPKPMALTSGIPSARRSLALCQNPARETAVSKIAQKSGIPGRGVIRPPTVRQSMPRVSPGNLKLAMEGAGSGMISKSSAGSRLRTPKAAAVKVKPTMTHSQLPPAPSSDKPQSRLGVPGPTRQLSIGGQNVHDAPSAKTFSGVRPPASTGLLRPGTSVRPPLPQSQKTSPKRKSQVQGLAAKKNPREIPTLGCQREIGSKAEGTSAVRSSAKRPPPALGSATEASSQPSSSLNQTVQTKAENHEKEQCSLSTKADVAGVPSISTVELADSELDQCRHLEMCKCCQERHLQLLQEVENLKKLIGKVCHTQVEVTHMAAT